MSQHQKLHQAEGACFRVPALDIHELELLLFLSVVPDPKCVPIVT